MNGGDNVITLVQPKSEEEGLLNVVITDRRWVNFNWESWCSNVGKAWSCEVG